MKGNPEATAMLMPLSGRVSTEEYNRAYEEVLRMLVAQMEDHARHYVARIANGLRSSRRSAPTKENNG